MVRKIYLSIILSAITLISFSQETKEGRVDRANKHFENYAYHKAINEYKESGDKSMESLRNLGNSYYRTNQYVEAEEVFKLIVKDTAATADDVFSYAAILEKNEKYPEAAEWMEVFAQQRPNDLRAISFIENTDYQLFLDGNGHFSIEHLAFNTEHQDFAPVYYQESIVFASSRTQMKQIKREWNWNQLPFLSLYVVDKIKDEAGKLTEDWTEAKPFLKKLNKKYHDGPVAFNADQNQLFLTRNNYENTSEDGVVKLQLFTATYRNEEWSELKAFPYNSSEYSMAHAHLSPDGKCLYFVSDMPGGFGGSDIYKVKVNEDGSYGEAVNLGDKINTESNEMFPFIHQNGMFFFASDGLAGLGGLDLFFTNMKDDGSFNEVRNLGFPMNTNKDDFALVLNDNASDGYFTSNRDGGKGDDDIYSFQMLPFENEKVLQGHSLTESGDTISNVKIVLISEEGIKIDSVNTNEYGAYEFVVEADKKYSLLGQKENFYDGHNEANTQTKEELIIADLVLQQNIVVLTEIVQINPIFFEFNKYNIQEDAAQELDKIVEVMNRYDSLVVELGSHTDCRGTKSYNEWLSDKRAKASAQYIKERITNPERIYGKGYGEYQLLNSCECEGDVLTDCDEEAHQLNRRTEFRVIKTGTDKVKIESTGPDSFKNSLDMTK